ncbi:MAG: N-acetylmuramoyl-L-alanine amidase [bacterium]
MARIAVRRFAFIAAIAALTWIYPAYAGEIPLRFSGDNGLKSLNSMDVEGDAFVSIRELAGALGLKVEWNGAKKEVTLKKGDKFAKFTVNDRRASIDGEEITLNRPIALSRDSTFIAARDVPALGKLIGREIDFSPKSGLTVGGPISEVWRLPPSPLPKAKGIRTVILDPGHGGQNIGAIGSKWGTKEKEIALDVALKVKDLLRGRNGLRVVMTRERDEFVSLSERTKFANEQMGDEQALFISIHANSCPIPQARGFEVFIYNQYASDEDAARTAALENEAATEEERNLMVRDLILNDIRGWGRLVESVDFADAIITKLLKGGFSAFNRGVKQANFFVLKNTRMPSILLEMAFLSNEIEEKRLRDEEYRERIAKALAEAIVEYIETQNRRIESEG